MCGSLDESARCVNESGSRGATLDAMSASDTDSVSVPLCVMVGG